MPFYTAKTRELEKIDFTHNRFVPVIASYNTSGNYIPLYFRYIYLDGTWDDVAIDRIINTKETIYHVIYCCSITVDDRKKQVSLTFHKDYMKWSVSCP